LKVFAISGLINCVVSIVLGFFVFSKNSKSTVNKTFFLMSLSIAFWSFGYWQWQISLEGINALFWVRVLSAGAILTPIFYFYHILTLLNLQNDKKQRTILHLGYLLSIIFLILNFTSLFVKDVVPKLSFNYWPEPGSAYPYFLIMFIGFISYACFLMIKSLQKLAGHKRNQIKYAILATIVGFGSGSTNYPLWYDIPIYPFGNFLVFSYTIILAYAIVRYHLLDIHLAFKRTAVYSISTGLLTGVFIILVLILSRYLSGLTGISELKLTVIPALIIALLFAPVKGRIQTLIDKIFYKKTYNYYDTIDKISHEFASTFNFRKICSFIGDIIFSTMGLKHVYLLYFVPGGGYRVVYSVLHEKDKETKDERVLKIDKDSEIVKLLSTSKDAVIREELSHIPTIKDETLDSINRELKPFKGEAVVPVFIDGKLELLMVFGEKLSGDIFSDEDIKLFSTISNQTAVAIKNTRFYMEKLRSERLASIGMMSATFAHEIKNPLTPIKTFFQLLPERYHEQDFRENFSKVAARSVEQIDWLIKDILDYSSDGLFVEMKDLDITELIEQTINEVKTNLELEKRNIVIERDYKKIKIDVFGDEKRLKQAFFNIIINSSQAIPESRDGRISISIKSNSDNVGISIKDNGEGISPDDITQIFEPFFTSKTKGIGLGLAITKKIIDTHNGKIEVDSRLNEGTNFIITLPIKK